MLLERDATGVATIRLNRPERLNAMNDELLDRLVECVERTVDDPAVRVIVVTGVGRGFCVGGDLQGFKDDGAKPGPTPEEQYAALRKRVHLIELLRASPAASVAAVNGACAGAGLGLALACDLRVAREGAVFRSAFLAAGLSGDFAGSWLLTRMLGEAKAKEIYLLDHKISAAEAARLGMVTAVHPAVRFETEVQALAARLAATAPIALANIKRNLADASNLSLADFCDVESQRHIDSYRTEDRAEAAAAFLERRTPVFSGR